MLGHSVPCALCPVPRVYTGQARPVSWQRATLSLRQPAVRDMAVQHSGARWLNRSGGTTNVPCQVNGCLSPWWHRTAEPALAASARSLLITASPQTVPGCVAGVWAQTSNFDATAWHVWLWFWQWQYSAPCPPLRWAWQPWQPGRPGAEETVSKSPQLGGWILVPCPWLPLAGTG